MTPRFTEATIMGISTFNIGFFIHAKKTYGAFVPIETMDGFKNPTEVPSGIIWCAVTDGRHVPIEDTELHKNLSDNLQKDLDRMAILGDHYPD